VTVAFVLHAAFTWIPAFAFVFAFGSVLLTLFLAQQHGQISTLRLILAGVVVGSVVLAISSYLSLIRADLVREVTAWTLGSLTFGSWAKIGSILPYWAIGTALLWGLARPLNTLQLGEATAYSLGVPVARLRWTVILASTLLTAAAVSYAGIIGFVGLMTPHILRRLIGANLSRLLPLSALAGGVFLLLADILARVIARPTELPVGLLTTLLGGPFFLYLLRKQN
jgi:iron complex transport system permease protein